MAKDLDDEIVYEEEFSPGSDGEGERSRMERPIRVYMELDV